MLSRSKTKSHYVYKQYATLNYSKHRTKIKHEKDRKHSKTCLFRLQCFAPARFTSVLFSLILSVTSLTKYCLLVAHRATLLVSTQYSKYNVTRGAIQPMWGQVEHKKPRKIWKTQKIKT